ncbi:MAG TPA: SH3 domain-containing C40 family peptidase [Chthonomonadaceae bacterium]|nr:SH3 domain-containing C40 family peptidase [Chthonomonadaceae bacterium]
MPLLDKLASGSNMGGWFRFQAFGLLTVGRQDATLPDMESEYALITRNVIAMRAEPNEGSEQVSQAILGDTVQWLERQGEFVRIGTRDSYTGWVLRQHLRPFAYGQIYRASVNPLSLEPHWPEGWQSAHANACRVNVPILDVLSDPTKPHGIVTKLVYGTWVLKRRETRRAGKRYAEIELSDFGGYVPVEALASKEALPVFSGNAACEIAARFEGTPYLWGGTTPFGFDCSGFVQRIYDMLGVTLPRDAHLQVRSPLGVSIPVGQPVKAGDLVFFGSDDDPRGRGITHVGMALGPRHFIHASGKLGVAVTGFDDAYYQRAYRGAWRCRPLSESDFRLQ